MPVIKVQHNMRLSADYNVSFSIETLVGSDEEAMEIGKRDQVLFNNYMEGVINATEDNE